MIRNILLGILFFSPAGDEKLRVEGPPFLLLGESATYEAFPAEKNVAVVWRIADAPGGIANAVETSPKYDANTFSIRGARRISVTSTGQTEGEMRLVVSLEREGRSIASKIVTVRLGPPVRFRVEIRPVEHAAGGPRETEVYRDDDRLKQLQESVNAIWKAGGVQFEFALGKSLRGENDWFDERGRLTPIVMKDGKKAKSPALSALFQRAKRGVINVFVVHELEWIEKGKGWGGVTVTHDVRGVGLQEEGVLLSDGADSTVLAHELGHYLGLNDLGADARTPDDVSKADRARLMFSIGKWREGTSFTYDEMKTARRIAAKLVKAPSK